MPKDFRSLHTTAQSIGFHELRQALEISSLKQDLERIARETDELRAHVEEAVERVRAQFAALTPEELADASRMAPLLQSAVKSLLGIRDAVRRVEVQAGPVPDADRAAPPPLAAPPLLTSAPPPAPSATTPPAPPPLPLMPSASPHTGAAPAPWLNPATGVPARGSANRPAAAEPPPAHAVDWLSPPRR